MADLKTTTVNAWESTLSSALASGATTINVTDTTGSPAVPFYATIDPGNDAKREVVLVDGSKTATTFNLSAATSRGQDGTSDVAHDSGAVIAIVPVAALWNDLHDRVDGHNHNAAYSTFRGVLVRNAAQTIPHNTLTVLQFDVVDSETDPDGVLTPATGTSAGWTVGRSGWYEIAASVRFATNSTGSRQIGIRRNGSFNYLAQSRAAGSADGAANVSVATGAELVSGDVIDVVLLQHSGAGLDTSQTHRTVHLTIAGRL